MEALGLPDARFGEQVVALVQPDGTGKLGEHKRDGELHDQLEEWCRTRLAGYKRPRRFLFVDTLKRSAAGKADYRYLRDLASRLQDE